MYFVKYTGPLYNDWVINVLGVVTEEYNGTYYIELITGEDVRADATDIKAFHNQKDVMYELFKLIKDIK